MQSSNLTEVAPGLEGPDYLALIIEWDDDDEDIDAAIRRELAQEPTRRTSTIRTIAAVVGALGAVFLAAWGIRRLRAA
jgi:hypothetical protein